MKKLLLLTGIVGALFMSSCDSHTHYVQPAPIPAADVVYDDYDVISNNGQQMVVYNDNGTQRLLEYALFMQLYNNGGMYNVRNYYVSHPTYFRTYDRSYYRSWRSQSYHTPSKYRSTPTNVGRSYNNTTYNNSRTVTPTNIGGGTSRRTPTWGGGNAVRPTTTVPQIRTTTTTRTTSPSWGRGSTKPASSWGGGNTRSYSTPKASSWGGGSSKPASSWGGGSRRGRY
jgi:hypothetical protein